MGSKLFYCKVIAILSMVWKKIGITGPFFAFQTIVGGRGLNLEKVADWMVPKVVS